jgi:hypothetical protein
MGRGIYGMFRQKLLITVRFINKCRRKKGGIPYSDKSSNLRKVSAGVYPKHIIYLCPEHNAKKNAGFGFSV